MPSGSTFTRIALVDLDGQKVDELQRSVGDRPDVHIYHGDANSVLLERIFPRLRYEDYRRGLCLLDPWGLHLDWRVVQMAGCLRSIDLFINFPLMDANRNALWHNPELVPGSSQSRMSRFWGDDSWRDVAYIDQPSLFGNVPVKQANKVIAEGYRRRLRDVACFPYVPEPLPMRNSHGAIVYYLFFAAYKPVAARIVSDIFRKYRTYGESG